MYNKKTWIPKEEDMKKVRDNLNSVLKSQMNDGYHITPNIKVARNESIQSIELNNDSVIKSDLFDLMSKNEVHVYRNTDGEVVEVLLYLYHFDLSKLVAGSYRSYLSDTDTRIVLRDYYIVVDVFDYIDEWLGHDIELYINQSHISNYIKY